MRGHRCSSDNLYRYSICVPRGENIYIFSAWYKIITRIECGCWVRDGNFRPFERRALGWGRPGGRLCRRFRRGLRIWSCTCPCRCLDGSGWLSSFWRGLGYCWLRLWFCLRSGWITPLDRRRVDMTVKSASIFYHQTVCADAQCQSYTASFRFTYDVTGNANVVGK